MKTPQEIVNTMMESDAFSKWLGISILELQLGYCKLQLTVTKEQLNGFSIAHGGISYAIADSALAFASNSRGNKCVSIETSISHIKPTQLNDILTAECTEVQFGKNIGRYEVRVTNQLNHCIAKFYGTVFRSTEVW